MIFRKKKKRDDKYIYGDITNRLFAVTIDMVILYFPMTILTKLALNAYFPAGDQFNITKNKIIARFPEAANDMGKLYQLTAENYPHDLEIIFRQYIFAICFQLIIIGIYTIPMVYKYGATLGKKVFGLKVVDVITEGPINFSQSVIRYIGYIAAVLPFMLGIFYGGARHNKRCWQDLLADTMVIYDPNRWYKKYSDNIKSKFRKFFNLQ